MTFIDLRQYYGVSAQEITDNDYHRTFHGYDDNNMENALTKFRTIIKEELNILYFETEGNKPFYHLKNGYFRGHVTEDEDGEPFILVDGKNMTIDDFTEFLKPYNGFRIEIRILD